MCLLLLLLLRLLLLLLLRLLPLLLLRLLVMLLLLLRLLLCLLVMRLRSLLLLPLSPCCPTSSLGQLCWSVHLDLNPLPSESGRQKMICQWVGVSLTAAGRDGVGGSSCRRGVGSGVPITGCGRNAGVRAVGSVAAGRGAQIDDCGKQVHGEGAAGLSVAVAE